MKITIRKEVTETVDVDLPMYVKLINCIARIDEDKVIEVEGNNLREYNNGMINFFIEKGSPVDKACFENAFQRALSKFNDLDREMKANDPEFLEHMRLHEENDKMIEEYGHEREQFNL